MDKKKILLIGNYSIDMVNKKVGGIEVYNNSLINVLKNYNYYYISSSEFSSLINYSNKFAEIMGKYNLEKLDEYDVIINSGYTYIPKKYANKTIFIQHTNFKNPIFKRKIYLNIFNLKKFIYKNLVFIFRPTLLSVVKNIAIFNEYHINKKISSKKIFFTYVPVTTEFKKCNLYQTANSILYVGRLDNKEKNLLLLNKIIRETNKNINIVGDGKDKNYIDNLERCTFWGWIDENEFQSSDAFKKSKVALFTSKWEGCCLSLHQVVRSGIIPIVRNFSPEIKAIIPDHLFNKLVCNRKKDFIKTIDWVFSLSENEYNKIIDDIWDHYKKTYSIDFFTNWNNLLKTNNFN